MRVRTTLFSVMLAVATAGQEPAAAWREQQLDAEVVMRDGALLAADVFLPATPGKYPAVLVQTPYNRKLFRPLMAGGDDPDLRREVISAAEGLLDREHYAYVVVDWRGFFGSRDSGRRARFGRLKTSLGSDGYDCVEWVAAQPWCDGKVGTWGPSALGVVQLATAAEQPPHLVCAAPLVASMGTHYQGSFPGGVRLSAHGAALDRLGFGTGSFARERPDPRAPAWSLTRRLTYHPEKVAVPTLFITGWWDHFPALIFDTWSDVRELGPPATRDQAKLIVGPWDHMRLGRTAQAAVSVPGAAGEPGRACRQFFDYWLRGARDNGWAAQPPLSYWVCDSGAEGGSGWRAAQAWPPAGTRAERWFLHADGVITPELPAAAPAQMGATNAPGAPAGAVPPLVRTLRGDPHHPTPTLGGANLPPLPHGPTDHSELLERDDVLVYRLGGLAEPMTLAGDVTVTASLSCDRVDCDLHVRLLWRRAGDGAVLLGDGAQRARWRDWEERGEQLLRPGQIVQLTVKLPPLALTLQPREELLVLLSFSNAPRYESNPHTGALQWEDGALPIAGVFHHSAEHPSGILLPVVR